VRLLACACLIAVCFPLLVAPQAFGSSAFAYIAATILFVLINAALVVEWQLIETRDAAIRGGAADVVAARGRAETDLTHHVAARAVAAIALTAGAGLLAYVAADRWLREILTYPNDAQRADMLVVIQHGIQRVLQGRNPYTIYHVPWEATLPYGPVLWAPFIAPYVLHADLRFASLLGELFVPIACASVASAAAWSGSYLTSLAALVMLAAMVFSPDLRNFAPIAHTPAYWPLVALFAWTVCRERWIAASLLAGLLIVARSTMVAIAPVVLIAVWSRDRRRIVPATLLLVLAAAIPYLPFAIWDLAALRYALWGSYQSLMKGFVWTSTPWARDTIGLTGLLLRAKWQALVEPVQIALMILVYAIAWRAIRAGQRPLPWMALSLLAFSMTTLWPVHYIYLDVLLLWICGALAETPWLARRRLLPLWIGTLAASALVVAAMIWTRIPSEPVIDIGSAADRARLYSGFSDDEQGDRSFAWVDGAHAEIIVPRRARRDATLELVCEPNLPTSDAAQDMSVALNGIVLGTMRLREGWQSILVEAPARAWRIGVNELTLSFSSAVSPLEAGVGADSRKLSVAFDRLIVRTK
jgi:hypothetical protein